MHDRTRKHQHDPSFRRWHCSSYSLHVTDSWTSPGRPDLKSLGKHPSIHTTWIICNESFVTTGTISRSPRAFPHIDTRPNVCVSRASIASLTSTSTTNRRPGGCVTDRRISTTRITLDQFTHEGQRPALVYVFEAFLMKLVKVFFVAVPLTGVRSYSSNESYALKQRQRVTFPKSLRGVVRFSGPPPSSLFRLLIRCISITSARPPPHPPRRTFSTPMTPSSINLVHTSCRIFCTTTTLLSDPVTSLHPNFFFSPSSDQDHQWTHMVQIRTERTIPWMHVRSAQADAHAERKSVRGCKGSAYTRGCIDGARTPVDANAERAHSVDATAKRTPLDATAIRTPVDVPLVGLLSAPFLLLVSSSIDPMDLPQDILNSFDEWTSPLLILCISTTVVPRFDPVHLSCRSSLLL